MPFGAASIWHLLVIRCGCSVAVFGARWAAPSTRAGRPATPLRVDSGSQPAESVAQLGVRFVARERLLIGSSVASTASLADCSVDLSPLPNVHSVRSRQQARPLLG